MSTFSGLNTAYTALVAARRGLDVVGQNIANVNTEGYTRQRVSMSAAGSVAETGLVSNIPRVGQGVNVDGIARLGNIFLDAKVRTSVATSGYWATRAASLGSLEATLQEPGTNGLSAQLQGFWGAWQDLANNPGTPASSEALLGQANVLTSQIARGYNEIDSQWASVRGQADGMVIELNEAGSRVAQLNAHIRSTLASGGSANELIDQRNNLTTTIAALAGGTVRELGDGTVEVLIGGNALVSGDAFRAVRVQGSYEMAGASGDGVQLEWVHRPGSPIAIDTGELGGALSLLAAANGGNGGALAEAAQSYNALATRLATTVNAVHQTGATATGDTGLDFFALDASLPAALGLSVVPVDGSGIAAGTPGAGAFSGTVADAISQVGSQPNSPDSLWSSIVVGIGVSSRTAAQQSILADVGTTAAQNAQFSHAAVDMDEENINMLSFQVAYQGAARVMTAVDEMLDTLINRMGLVGR